jgi:hypothetical protein
MRLRRRRMLDARARSDLLVHRATLANGSVFADDPVAMRVATCSEGGVDPYRIAGKQRRSARTVAAMPVRFDRARLAGATDENLVRPTCPLKNGRVLIGGRIDMARADASAAIDEEAWRAGDARPRISAGLDRLATSFALARSSRA